MKAKSKFETVWEGPFEVVTVSTTKKLTADFRDTETEAVTLAKKLLRMARCDTGVGAIVFEHDGAKRLRKRRAFVKLNGEVTEKVETLVIR